MTKAEVIDFKKEWADFFNSETLTDSEIEDIESDRLLGFALSNLPHTTDKDEDSKKARYLRMKDLPDVKSGF